MRELPSTSALPNLLLGGLLLASAPLRAEETGGLLGSLDLGVYAFIVLVVLYGMYRMSKRRRREQLEHDYMKRSGDMTHAARLAIVGEITASVFHEVTQPLSAILSNIETAEILLDQPHPDLKEIRVILADVRRDDLRAHGIVRRLRGLLHKRSLQCERVDMNDLVSDVLALILPDARRRDVVVCTDLAPGLPAVHGDPVHLQQVILNLLINAMDAMETAEDGRKREGRIDICTERGEGSFVKVSVLDKGSGIDSQNVEKVFDSFFTTKTEGMGLGLSIARHIIQLHGGAIWAENRGIRGAAFRFTVPIASSEDR